MQLVVRNVVIMIMNDCKQEISDRVQELLNY